MIAKDFKIAVMAFAVVTLLLLGSPSGFPAGLEVVPGGLLVQHIKPGERYNLEAGGGLRLKIINRSADKRTYRISVATPGQLGIMRWIEGYVPIPEPRWFSVEPAEIEVAPQSEGYANMFIETPAETRYFNQHWVVALAVQGKLKKGEALALALKPVYYLETESRMEVTSWLPGSPGIAPTTLNCNQAPATKKGNGISCGQLVVFNGDSRSHTFAIGPAIPQATDGGQKISPSPGFTWLASPGSVMVSADRITLEPHESRSVSVRLMTGTDMPAQTHRKECLLWIRPEQGSARFVRVKIE